MNSAIVSPVPPSTPAPPIARHPHALREVGARPLIPNCLASAGEGQRRRVLLPRQIPQPGSSGCGAIGAATSSSASVAPLMAVGDDRDRVPGTSGTGRPVRTRPHPEASAMVAVVG
jgi:hypothetical protein